MPASVNLSRRSVLAGAALPAASLLPVASWGQSATPAALPAVSRFKVGEMTVTALSDGYLTLPHEFWPTLSAEEYAELLDQAAFRSPVYTGGVTAYLIETADRRILIDAGTGAAMGPTLGQFASNLALLGVAPESIDTIIATHLHPDHIGGLMQDGTTAFGQSELVVHTADQAFWTDADIRSQFPADFHPFFDLAAGVLALFEDRLRPVTSETEIAPGLTTVPLPGHTPGHMGVRIESGGDTVLMWGDIVHAAPLQMARPEVTIAFDVDQEAAAATRQTLFDMAATDRLFVLGSHLPFPGFGYLERRSIGYGFMPAHWEYA